MPRATGAFARARGLDRVRLLVATAGGAGLIPKAPGTFGSLVGLALALLVPGDSRYPWIAGAIAVAASLGCIALGSWCERFFADRDPSPVVLDEVAGMLVATLAQTRPPLHWCVVAFAMFRYFDIRKPLGIGRLQRLPGGVGILADDLAAGGAAFAVGTGGRLLAASIGT
ncbi:MAG TPA: phosphatidylglycerophosphatase A [Planctomycetota bacterium]|nr:phosphatidylglycerophosphatase A [Planctomycetota bacterium]